MSWRLWKAAKAEVRTVPFGDGTPVEPPVSMPAPMQDAQPPITPAPISIKQQRRFVPDSPISEWLRTLHTKYKDDFTGQLANYIPELTRVDPGQFGIVIAMADGKIYEAGDSQALFTMQSVSKPLVYGLALEDHGPEDVLRRVGVEPTGEAFNSIVMDEANNRPFNPMVNAGAIATTSLVKGVNYAARWNRILGMFSRYAGRPLTVDESVFKSERTTGHRNRTIAYLQLNSGMIQEPVEEHLDLYFQQCAIQVSARDLAMMAATLANSGVNPVTGERAIDADNVRNVLTVMASCGMYDYSGEWVYRVGLPAKSGVGGGIIAVLPGQFGFGVFSPLLDVHGNSHRGIQVCKELSQRFHLHVYDTDFIADRVVRRSYRCGPVTSKRQRGARERAALDRAGARIIVYELQGALQFATAEQMMRRMISDIEHVSFVILDARRIVKADRSALLLLRDMSRILSQNHKVLLIAGFDDEIQATWKEMQEGAETAICLLDVDIAIEHCENQLIAEVDPSALLLSVSVPLADMDILRGMSPAQIARLEPYLEHARYAAGDAIIREGDVADRIFLLESGSAFVSVRLDDGERTARMAAFRPGVVFGEFALFDGGRRVADVIAETATSCYVLTFRQLQQLEQKEPDLYQRILFALGRFLTDRLRRTTAEVRALS